MNSATGGYLSGLDYLYYFQPEANPLRVQFAMLAAGIAPPRIQTACELGFGQGLSVNIHAAAQTVRWYGTDFNPAQVGFARDLAAASGAEVNLYDQSFAEFCARPDLPDFDLITLHGVWSWTSDENRSLIVDFIGRRLAVGGVVHVSYNVQPGFSTLIPLHPVLTQHGTGLGRPGEDPTVRIDAALAFTERVLTLSPAYTSAHPRVAELLRAVRLKDRRYLAHEYLNAGWTPTSFARVSEAFAAAKLEYACSPSLLQSAETLELSADQRALLAEIRDPGYREVVRDLMVNRSFRVDYWVKGARRLPALERCERLLAQRVVLIRPPEEVLKHVKADLGAASTLQAAMAAVIASLSDHRPQPLSGIAQAAGARGVSVAQLLDATELLVNLGGVAPAQDDAAAEQARARTARLNAQLCTTALHGAEIRALASPLTGTGFAETGGRIALFFLHAIGLGLTDSRGLAGHALRIFQSLGIGLFRDGKPIEATEEKLALLTGQAQHFLDRQLPVLRAMQIAN